MSHHTQHGGYRWAFFAVEGVPTAVLNPASLPSKPCLAYTSYVEKVGTHTAEGEQQVRSRGGGVEPGLPVDRETPWFVPDRYSHRTACLILRSLQVVEDGTAVTAEEAAAG